METNEIKCDKCGNEDNFHFNRDHGRKDLPVENVVCNECGHVVELKEKK